MARWTQQDPLFGNLPDPTSLNRYIYAGCNPVNFVDPSGLRAAAGHYALACGIGAGAAAAGVALTAGLSLAAAGPAALQACVTALAITFGLDVLNAPENLARALKLESSTAIFLYQLLKSAV